MEVEEKVNNIEASQNITQDPSVVRYMLETSPIKKQLEITLAGKIMEKYVNTETGEIITEEKILSKPKCNKEGYQAIVSMFSMVVNPQGLEGNLEKKDDYLRYISSVYEGLATDIMKNRKKWDITPSDYPVILNCLMNSIKIMLTHSIGAGTRKSITQASRIQEYATMPQKNKGIFGMFSK